MNNHYILSAFTALLLLVPIINPSAQIQQTVSFDREKLSVGEKIGDDGVTYALINYDHNPSIQDEGAPQLPYRIIHLLVPEGMNDFSVSVTPGSKEVINLSHPIYPVQKPGMTSTGAKRSAFVAPDQAIYISDALYPANTARICGDGYFDGNKHIVSIALSPAQYQPASGQLCFYQEMNVTITSSTTLRSVGEVKIKPISRNRGTDLSTLGILQKIVENKTAVTPLIREVESMENTENIRLKGGNVSTIPSYEYCIITSKKLAPAFERLLAWKRMKGLETGVVTVEEILADPNMTGDINSNLFDDAGKIRQYLTGAYYQGTRYVFFGGNSSIVPIRYGYHPATSVPSESYIPADIYFSDLNSRWKTGQSGNSGNTVPDTDLWPELYVGRLLCTTDEQIKTYTDKLIKYEMNPADGRESPGNMEYLKKAFYMQSDQMQDLKQSQEKIEILDTIFTVQTLFEEQPSFDAPSPTFPTGNDVIREMNNGYGFFCWSAHADPTVIKTMSKGINENGNCIVSVQGVGKYQESANGLNNLTNSLKPAIVYTVGCTTTPFDNYQTSGLNLGEAFTVAGSYGGPAYLGNTRLGWLEGSNDLYNFFVKRIASGERRLSIAEALSKCDYQSNAIAYTHNLVGCPELEIWTDTPALLNIKILKQTSSSLSFEYLGPTKCDFHYHGLFSDDGFRQSSSPNGTFIRFPQSHKAYTTMVTKANGLPFFPPLLLQNVNITGNSYIFGSSAYIGNKVGFGTTTGDVIIKPDAKITLEMSEGIVLEKGFEIEPGGSFELKRFNP